MTDTTTATAPEVWNDHNDDGGTWCGNSGEPVTDDDEHCDAGCRASMREPAGGDAR